MRNATSSRGSHRTGRRTGAAASPTSGAGCSATQGGTTPPAPRLSQLSVRFAPFSLQVLCFDTYPPHTTQFKRYVPVLYLDIRFSTKVLSACCQEWYRVAWAAHAVRVSSFSSNAACLVLGCNCFIHVHVWYMKGSFLVIMNRHVLRKRQQLVLVCCVVHW